MKRFALAALLVLAPKLAFAQLTPPVPCVALLPDGRASAPGFSFGSFAEGRLVMLLRRSRDGVSEVTDFLPVPNRPGSSYFHENFEVRIGDRPRSLFILASGREDGTFLIERWDRADPRPAEFSSYILRCAR